ncbi:MAG: dienelactone hydrolase family protein [Myxococcales bacterium]|nr:dienelactone hydrolase family protein [Myxococcales bacterium]
MGTTIELEAADGHKLSAYRAEPQGAPRGGVLVIQEIFGVNDHIRSVCDGYAQAGYLAIAPALFDRVERGVELGYDEPGIQGGIKVVSQMKPGNTLRDLQAATDALSEAGKVGVVGYCYGGTMAWVSAAKLEGIACAAGYYGGQIDKQVALSPRVPVILHFGERDHAIPMEAVDAVRKAHPDVPVHVYPAGHGFNCDARDSYDAESAKLARERTLELFAKHVG